MDIRQSVAEVYGNRVRVRICGVCVEDEKILLVNQAGVGEDENFWSLPGGGLEPGETATACLQREFIEETGLTVEVNQFLFVQEFLQLPLHAIELFFQVKTTGGELTTGSDPELNTIREVRWWHSSDLQNLPPLHRHHALRDLKNPVELLHKSGYFYASA
jgi:8-oxo-dGTP diphosphatase